MSQALLATWTNSVGAVGPPLTGVAATLYCLGLTETDYNSLGSGQQPGHESLEDNLPPETYAEI